MHAATAVLGLTATALLTAGLHYENQAETAPHLEAYSKIPTAAIAWGGIATIIIPVFQAITRWPNRRATTIVGSLGATLTIGTALTALAANMEAEHAPDTVLLSMQRHMGTYGTDPAIAQEIDEVQRDYACCGAQGPAIYETTRDHITGEVPESCCSNQGHPCNTLDIEQLHQRGCAEIVGQESARSLQILMALMAAHALTIGLATASAVLVNAGRCN